MTELQELRIKCGEAYNAAVRWLKDNKDHEDYKLISILVSEFYLSYDSQRELYNKCLELGIVKPE